MGIGFDGYEYFDLLWNILTDEQKEEYRDKVHQREEQMARDIQEANRKARIEGENAREYWEKHHKGKTYVKGKEVIPEELPVGDDCITKRKLVWWFPWNWVFRKLLHRIAEKNTNHDSSKQIPQRERRI